MPSPRSAANLPTVMGALKGLKIPLPPPLHVSYAVGIYSPANISLTLAIRRDPTQHNTMAGSMYTTISGKRNILLITDSRGRFLQGYLNHHNRNFLMVNYTVEVHSGSKLNRLWRLTKQRIQENNFDLIYLLGGICDITHKQYVRGNKVYWPNMDQGQIGSELIDEYVRIVTEFNGLKNKNNTKICLIPEVGGDFIRYNNASPTNDNLVKQSAIELSLPTIQKAAKNANQQLEMPTPWIIDTIFRRNKRGELVPEYQRLEDGIHPTQRAAERAAIAYIKHAHNFFGLNKPSIGNMVNEVHLQL